MKTALLLKLSVPFTKATYLYIWDMHKNHSRQCISYAPDPHQYKAKNFPSPNPYCISLHGHGWLHISFRHLLSHSLTSLCFLGRHHLRIKLTTLFCIWFHVEIQSDNT